MAARKANLQYGLITIPALLDVATISKQDMSNLCVGQPANPLGDWKGGTHDALPVKAPKTCTTCGPITDLTVLKKGVKSGSTFTIVDAEAVTEAREEYAADHKGVLQLVPHPAGEFLASTAQGDSLHYVTPADAAGANHYQLLVKLVNEHPELAFVTLYTPVSATSLYMLQVRNGVLVLQKRVREGQMKPTPSVGGDINGELYAMLEATLEDFTKPYAPADYEDHFATAVEQMIASGEKVSVASEVSSTTTPVAMSDDDLMTQLAKLKEGA